jgi:transcriptional regulator of arginine metabolism
MITPAKRRQRIRDLLSRNEVTTQEQLEALLEAEGITTTQATISRDLREIGVRKARDVYVLPAEIASDGRERKRLVALLRQRVLSVHRSGTLVVLRTDHGLAPAVALEIEAAKLPHVLGAVAGADTVFIAAETAMQSRVLQRMIESA